MATYTVVFGDGPPRYFTTEDAANVVKGDLAAHITGFGAFGPTANPNVEYAEATGPLLPTGGGGASSDTGTPLSCKTGLYFTPAVPGGVIVVEYGSSSEYVPTDDTNADGLVAYEDSSVTIVTFTKTGSSSLDIDYIKVWGATLTSTGAYFVIDLEGVVFTTDGSGDAGGAVDGDQQFPIPEGLPADPTKYAYSSSVWSWDTDEIIAHPELGPHGYTVTSEEAAGTLASTAVYGSLDLGDRPGSFQKTEDRHLVADVPPDSGYVSPFPKVYVRFRGDVLVPGSFIARAVVTGGALVIQTSFDYMPGAIDYAISLAPFDSEPEPAPLFWTGFLGTREIP